MIKTEFMELLEELDSLYEAPDFYASKTFWADAKAGELNDQAFNKAYKDEIYKLGLGDLIDWEYRYSYYQYGRYHYPTPTHTGVLKDKSSYGEIKKAAEANPDSWAVKAMLKMWVLQFKDGIKSNSQIKMEKDEAEAVVRKQENEAKEAAYKAAEKEFKDTYLQDVTDTVNKVAADFAPKAYATAKGLVEKIVKLADDTKALSKGFVVDHSARDYGAFLNLAENDLIKMHYSIEGNSSYPYYPSNPEFKIKVWVFKFLNIQDEKLRSYARQAEVGYDYYAYCWLRPGDFTEEIITEKVLKMLKPLSEVILADLEESVTWRQENFDKLNKKVTAAKKAQAAADASKPVDPNFSKDILSLFEEGLKKADRSANIWSDSTSDNQAVAYILGLHDSVQEIAPALLYCNWRAVCGDQEVASWRMTDSIRNLKDAITDAIDEFKRDNSLTIEVIKN